MKEYVARKIALENGKCAVCGGNDPQFRICEDDLVWLLRARKFLREQYGSTNLSQVVLTAEEWP